MYRYALEILKGIKMQKNYLKLKKLRKIKVLLLKHLSY